MNRRTAAEPAGRVTLERSYAACRALHRAHGTTYYWATKALPAIIQPHVHALYGVCRFADEIVDGLDDAPVPQRVAALDALRDELTAGISRGESDHIVLKAVVHTAKAFDLDVSLFERFFRSMALDLTQCRYATYGDLFDYMDGSAAVIGEMMLPLLEPADRTAALHGARSLGIAFQLTNFLRDVGEDLDRGRIYFPIDELDRFGVDPVSRCVDDQWRAFCRFQIGRIRALYRDADCGIEYLSGRSAAGIQASRRLYAQILDRIEAHDFDVFASSTRADATQARGRDDRTDPEHRMTTISCDEVVLVDADDNEIGRRDKLEAHQWPGLRHRAFSVVLFDGRGRLLLQQRARSKYHFGGRWSNSCCGHPRPGEDVPTAAVRRVHEELGLRVSLQDTSRFEYHAQDPVTGLVEHEIDHVLLGRAIDVAPAPDPTELEDWLWIERWALDGWLAREPTDFTPWLPLVLHHTLGCRP